MRRMTITIPVPTVAWKRLAAFAIAGLLGLVALTACEEPSTSDKERQKQQDGYEKLADAQPPKTMDYSPTRETINFWIDTWDEKDKLSYVYLQASNGQLVGYYIFEGLPVSYCAMLTPPYEMKDTDETEHIVPGPGMDGAFYSGSQCAAYYGKDATTGSYIEYTVGTGISALIYEQPLPKQDVEPLGFTEVKDIKD